jgi:hypothetical protein
LLLGFVLLAINVRQRFGNDLGYCIGDRDRDRDKDRDRDRSRGKGRGRGGMLTISSMSTMMTLSTLECFRISRAVASSPPPPMNT